jgi:Cu2+-exporting ATPase
MLAFAIGGALIHPALYVPCGLLMLHEYVSYSLPLAYQALKERRLDINVLHAFFVTGSIAGGFFFATAVGSWYVALMRLLLVKTEVHSKKSLINLFGEQPRFVWVLVDGVERYPLISCKSGTCY